MQIDSDFALLDVKKGRHALAKRLAKSGPVQVMIIGTITHQWGNDDGTSIEFGVSVSDVTTFTDGRQIEGIAARALDLMRAESGEVAV